MRTIRTLLLASSLLAVPFGTGHAQTPQPSASAPPAAAPSTVPTAPPAASAPSAPSAAPTAPPAAPTAPPVAPATVAPTTQPAAPAPSVTPAPVDTGAAASPPAPSAPARKLPPLKLDDAIAGGVGLASIVVGVALVGAAAGVHASIRSSVPRDLRGNPSCGATGDTDVAAAPELPLCADLRNQARTGTDVGNTGVAFLVTGGLLVGAATAYWLLSSPPPAPGTRSARSVRPPTLRVLPSAGATGGGLVVVGSF